MKLRVSVWSSLSRDPAGRVADRIRHVVQSAASVHRLREELVSELEAVSASARAADPEFRRDALERAVRRTWGTTQ